MNTETVGRPMEILLIEDSLTDARLAIEALRTGDIMHRLTLVRDGQEAMDFLERRHMFARAPRPDLILLDLQLPKCDGRDVLTIVREHRDLKTIPVVILTSSQVHEDIVRGELLQVDGYLPKPVDVDQFVTLVRQLKHFWHADVILPQSVNL
jgi:two-component system, chemotaxis family, response regulator Rcp1